MSLIHLPNAAARIDQVITSGDTELGRALFPKVQIEA